MTQKIVINKCYGGYGLSHKAVMRYAELKGIALYPFIHDGEFSIRNQKYKAYSDDMEIPFFGVYYSTAPLPENGTYQPDSWFSDDDIERTDNFLIQTVEELGDAANGPAAKLRIIEIPDGIEWVVDDYDGIETVEEKHNSWG